MSLTSPFLHHVLEPGDVVHVNVIVVAGFFHILHDEPKERGLGSELDLNGDPGLVRERYGESSFAEWEVVRSAIKIRSGAAFASLGREKGRFPCRRHQRQGSMNHLVREADAFFFKKRRRRYVFHQKLLPRRCPR